MKTIRTIVVFDDDQYLLALLKGYCFANNIELIGLSFELETIKEIEKLMPAIVVVPVHLLNAVNKKLEVTLLKRINASDQLRVLGFTKNPSNQVTPALTGWVDVVINNPYDISEFGGYIKKFILFINNIKDRRMLGDRRCYERRSFASRRSQEYNAELNQNDNASRFQGQDVNNLKIPVNPCFKELEIDKRKKCLFLKGKKVDLTPKEFELVELLATDIERVFTADEIIKHLWPTSDRATKSDLYQYMHLLRKKIEKDPDNPRWIMTVKGFGYKLNVDSPEKVAFQG